MPLPNVYVVVCSLAFFSTLAIVPFAGILSKSVVLTTTSAFFSTFCANDFCMAASKVASLFMAASFVSGLSTKAKNFSLSSFENSLLKAAVTSSAVMPGNNVLYNSTSFSIPGKASPTKKFCS
ncbi:hypothetical protein D3C72_753910 [compost metagenome]